MVKLTYALCCIFAGWGVYYVLNCIFCDLCYKLGKYHYSIWWKLNVDHYCTVCLFYSTSFLGVAFGLYMFSANPSSFLWFLSK